MGSPDCVVEHAGVVELAVAFFGGLREQGLVELLVGFGLHLVLVVDFGHVLLPPVGNLQEEHAVVVDHIEEDDNVDDQGEQVLHGGPGVTFVDLFCVDLGADEDELHDDDGDEVDDPAGVVVEEEELGLVMSLPLGYQSLVLRLDLGFLGGEMLGIDLAIIADVVLGFLGDIGVLYPDDGGLLLVVDLEELYLLEHKLSVILFAHEA